MNKTIKPHIVQTQTTVHRCVQITEDTIGKIIDFIHDYSCYVPFLLFCQHTFFWSQSASRHAPTRNFEDRRNKMNSARH